MYDSSSSLPLGTCGRRPITVFMSELLRVSVLGYWSR